MTAANNLADMLSNLLNSLQNPGMGEGKGKGNSFSLPDIIKKQKGLGEKIKEGIEKGGKKGEGKKKGGGGGEQMSGEQYQIYQEQNTLRQALQEIMGKDGKTGSKGQEALERMEELEKQLLDKGFTNEVLQQMIHIEHELLKLEDATLKQGKDNKRNSETNEVQFNRRDIPEIKSKKLYFNTNEILDREPLPLRSNYKWKVQEYFKIKSNE